MSYRAYGSRTLSEPEILLTQLYERREKAQLAAQMEAQAERKLLGTMAATLSYRSVITTAAGLNKAAAAAAEEEREAAAAAATALKEEQVDNAEEKNPTTAAARSKPLAVAAVAAKREGKAKGGTQEEGLDSIFAGQYVPDEEDEEEEEAGDDGEALRNDFADASRRIGKSGASASAGAALQLRKKARSAEAEAEADAEVIVDLDTLDSTALYASGYLSVDGWDPKTATTSRSFTLDRFGTVPDMQFPGECPVSCALCPVSCALCPVSCALCPVPCAL